MMMYILAWHLLNYRREMQKIRLFKMVKLFPEHQKGG